MNWFTRIVCVVAALVLTACATVAVTPVAKAPVREVWNKVNPQDITVAVLKSSGPGGHIVLHLDQIKAIPGIDNVQVYMDVVCAGEDGSVIPGRAHVGSVVIGNVGFTGDKEFDVSEKFATLLAINPQSIANFTLEFVIQTKNHSVRQNEDSFSVGWTYFSITDKDGKPVAQAHLPPRYGNAPDTSA